MSRKLLPFEPFRVYTTINGLQLLGNGGLRPPKNLLDRRDRDFGF